MSSTQERPMPLMSFWWRRRGWRWRGLAIAAANSSKGGAGQASGPRVATISSSATASAGRSFAQARCLVPNSRRRSSRPSSRRISTREARSLGEARFSKTRSLPADIRWTRRERSPNSTTGILLIRRTPVISRPASASSGGSKVFITFMPGARTDSTVAPRTAASIRRAVILPSGNSGMPIRMPCPRPRLGRLRARSFDLVRPEGLPANRGKEGLMQELPTIQPNFAPELAPGEITALSEEIRARAAERNAVILAHNYQLPEIQDVADHLGDSLGLSRAAAATDAEAIVFCGVHFMAETASILSPDKKVLIPDLDAGCSLADSIDAEQLRAWKAEHPGAMVVMYVNTSAAVKAETDYCCTSSNAVGVVEHIWREHGDDTEILFGPDMWLGAFVERETGLVDQPERRARFHIWDGECHVHAGIRPDDIARTRAEHPEAEFLIHPECGCSTQAMEYVAAGDIDSAGVHMLSTSGMQTYVEEHPEGEFIVATENGMLYPLQQVAPKANLIEANRMAVCQSMKMITLPKLRDSLVEMKFEVSVPAEIAERAKLPIERMVAIG